MSLATNDIRYRTRCTEIIWSDAVKEMVQCTNQLHDSMLNAPDDKKKCWKHAKLKVTQLGYKVTSTEVKGNSLSVEPV